MRTQAQTTMEYTMGRSREETQRLIQQAGLLDTFTAQLFAEAGIAPGMKVLDAGSGAGDVALLAARFVGPAGAVVGVDTNPAILAVARQRCAQAGLAQMTFVEGDLRTARLDDDFDAVVGRNVLTYVPDPGQALRRLARHVRPGGIIAFQEIELGPFTAYFRNGALGDLGAKLWSWMDEVFRRSGANPSMGFGLYRAFQEAGLGAPQMALHALMGGAPDWVGWEYSAATYRSLLPLFEQYGITTRAELDPDTLAARMRATAEELGHPAIAAPCVTAWART